MQISLMFFASDGAADGERHDRYRLLLDGCRRADAVGLTAVWLPERHFHRFGGLFPSPAVAGAAVAAITQRLRIRAGSVIIPLNDPVRVAEEWSMVDNLSGGRVDLGFGQGWNPNDFVLKPENFDGRLGLLYEGIDQVRRLWSGQAVTRRNGVGQDREIAVFPHPVQDRFGLWLTCSGGAERFEEAGRLGARVLTALLFQDVSELERKIDVYRAAWEEAGHPGQGHVTLMLHTYVGEDPAEVRATVREPFLRYLADSADLWKQNYPQYEQMPPEDRQRILEFAFEKYLRTHSLCGALDDCARRAEALRVSGVDEIACLIDFGVDRDRVLGSLDRLGALQAALAPQAEAAHG